MARVFSRLCDRANPCTQTTVRHKLLCNPHVGRGSRMRLIACSARTVAFIRLFLLLLIYMCVHEREDAATHPHSLCGTHERAPTIHHKSPQARLTMLQRQAGTSTGWEYTKEHRIPVLGCLLIDDNGRDRWRKTRKEGECAMRRQWKQQLQKKLKRMRPEAMEMG
jgi:hypothetical protein